MEGTELLNATKEAMVELSDKINFAGIQSSFKEGRYHHEIAHGMDIPSSGAAQYFRNLAAEAEASPEVLSKVPMDKVQEVYDSAREALDTDLEGSIMFYANVLSDKSKAGTKMTDEDKEKMKPCLAAMKALIEYRHVKDAYTPRGGD